MPKDVKEWMDRNHIAHYFRAASKNFFFHANTFTEMIQARGYEKIASIESKECRHMRAEMHDDSGIIQNYFYSMHWAPKKGSNKRKNSIEKIPGYHPLYHKKLPGKKFIYHTGDELLSDDYYFEPTWWGGKEWISTANAVPRFHNANLRNGYTLRWHIEYPKDYFDSSPAVANSKEDIKKSQDKRKTRKREFIRQVNEMLAGYENAGRALFTSYEINRALGKDFPGIKITPLKADIKDDALLKLFEKSNQANISAQAIHPTLANIETQGKLSSGSEIRNAYNMYLAIKTSVVRDILLEPINLVKKINKWPEDIHFGFRDIELTKLDDNKEAKQEVITE